MNVSKKDRRLDALRKRKSSSKPASHGTHNGGQQRASLLKNNKSLAITLQETRCELSAYKNFFEDSLEFINNAKLAKSRMSQLSDAFKTFLKDFDENLILLNFDESKLLNVKPTPQKSYQNNMNPVLEVASEVSEEFSIDQGMNYDEENSPNYSDQVLEKAVDEEKSNYDSKTVSKSPQKKTENYHNSESNKDLGPSSQTEDAEGNENAEAPNTPVKEISKKIADLNSVQKPFLLATLSTQSIKSTKIPRCQSLDLLKKKCVKESCKPQYKACKRKSPVKVCEESDANFSRRKTFVVKNSNVLSATEHSRNVTDENESKLLTEGTSNLPEDLLISKNCKRQTFIIKVRDALKETEPVTNFKNAIDKELITESKVAVDETMGVQDDILIHKNRKTFVKKSSLHQNDVLECQLSFPNRACSSVNPELVSAVIENDENNNQNENLKSSPNLLLNGEHSETDNAAIKSKLLSSENSKNIEHVADLDTSLNPNITFSTSSKEMFSGSINNNNKMKELYVNLQSNINNVVTVQTTGKAKQNADVLNKGIIFSDDSLMNENNKEVCISPIKTFRSFLESSESNCEMMVKGGSVDFTELEPALLQTTPIRRKITKNKKKKFVFDGKKRKTIVKKKSQCEIINTEISENFLQKSDEVYQSGVDAVTKNKNDVIKIRGIDDMHMLPNVILNRDNPVIISTDTCTTKKISKTSRNKDNQSKSAKNNIEKKPNKVQRAKNKINPSTDIEVDDLISQSKKVKKRNVKKKKNEHGASVDDNAISKFVELNKVTNIKKVKGDEKEPESDFPCKKTGKNTFLVRAEIHPPPSSLNMPGIEEISEENEKLNLQHMQVTVVLNDILKSKNIELLNMSDKSLLCGTKSPFSANTSNLAIDLEDSIEKLRCDPAYYVEDCDLHTDAVLETASSDVPSNPVLDIENTRRRRRKEVNYKEKSLHRKMRRC